MFKNTIDESLWDQLSYTGNTSKEHCSIQYVVYQLLFLESFNINFLISQWGIMRVHQKEKSDIEILSHQTIQRAI